MQVCSRCRIPKSLDEFSPSYRGKSGTWCRACFAEYNRKRQRGEPTGPSARADERTCQRCGAKYTPMTVRPNGAFCSRKCKGDARNAAQRAERLVSKPDRWCVWCSGAMPKAMRVDAKFCSDKCNNAAHAATRKAAHRSGLKNRDGDLISLAYIAERDKWRCGICGGRVAKALRHPDPMAPSVDHIVPLAAGGAPGDPANLQLTHLVCNLRKRDVPMGEQLRLLG